MEVAQDYYLSLEQPPFLFVPQPGASYLPLEMER